MDENPGIIPSFSTRNTCVGRILPGYVVITGYKAFLAFLVLGCGRSHRCVTMGENPGIIPRFSTRNTCVGRILPGYVVITGYKAFLAFLVLGCGRSQRCVLCALPTTLRVLGL